MSFYSAFPSSPLSRSALASERTADKDSTSKASPKPPKAYGQIASFTSPDSPRPSLFGTSIDADADRFESIIPSPLGPATSGFSAAPSSRPSSRHVSGPVRLMRSPFGPSRSPTSNTPFDEGYAVSPPMPSSSFSRSINTRRRSSGYSFSASSPTPNFGSLVGSFQESLLRGRMSMPASKPLIFDAEIGVLGMGRCKPSLRCPPHLHVKFPAHFYDFHAIDAPAAASNVGSTAALGSPYVGTIDLEAHYHNMLLTRRLSALSTDSALSTATTEPVEVPAFPGYAVPPKGQIQLIVKYPDLNAVKLFLVPYDLTNMQPGTKTFVRQKTMVRPSHSTNPSAAPGEEGSASNRSTPCNVRAPAKEALRFAIHLQFCCPPSRPQHDDHQAGFDGSEPRRLRSRSEAGQTQTKKSSGKASRPPRIYLHKSIRLVFGARALDSGEKLVDQVETPGQGAQRFSAYNGPEEDWLQLHYEARSAHRSTDEFRAASLANSASLSSPPQTGASAMRPNRSGLGIVIQGPTMQAARSAVGIESDDHAAPLNSDPNGERWQGSASSMQQSANVRDQYSGRIHSPTSLWSASSQESNFGQPSHGWSRTGTDGQFNRQLALSLTSYQGSSSVAFTMPANARMDSLQPGGAIDASSAPQPFALASSSALTRAVVGSDTEPASAQSTRWTPRSGKTSVSKVDADLTSTPAAQAAPRSSSPLPPPMRPSRIRSASTAGLSEARVQSVSALGRVEESAATSLQTESVSVDSPFSLRRPAKKANNDRPSLLRKLSEQFARSHTPSPTASPKLRPAWRQAEDELAEMMIDDADGASVEPAPEALPQRVTRPSIR
ncbi:uncharacterized protein UTRI_10370_B [Ustilago trichophora]|uniref:Atos-like conserved domain-containing protein n=1 Tax=Ustilago trichophora TaxID=86804 RepID=A0A5C3EBB7_9BASI|nr:uncharacterized protein UTRI_10370_B [Ustilago trichophora]